MFQTKATQTLALAEFAPAGRLNCLSRPPTGVGAVGQRGRNRATSCILLHDCLSNLARSQRKDPHVSI
jgi:hypothetical protein